MTLVLLNPHAQGGRAGRCAPALARWLALHAPQARLCAPQALAQALDLLHAQAQGSRVVVVGGDGTINRWLPALLQRQLEMGLVPMGSGNDVARALGLQVRFRGRPLAALDHALHAATQSMDLGQASWRTKAPARPAPAPTNPGEASSTLFLSSLTAGFDAAIALRALLGPRWLQGLPRYLWATLGELASLQTWPMTVDLDGQTVHEGPALFASSLNTPSFGSGMPAVPHARTDDGQLDLLLAGHFGRAGALGMLPRLLSGIHLGHARIQTRGYRRLSVECARELPLAADGEYLGVCRQLEVTVLPGALRVVSA